MKSHTVCLLIIRLVACSVLGIASFSTAKTYASQNIPQPQTYQVFTQHKGQLLNDAMSSLPLNSVQKRLIKSLPITKAARSDRQFHLGFIKEKGKSLLREIQVIRGKSRANFLIKLEKGKPVAKSVKTLANLRQIVNKKPQRTIVKPVTINDPSDAVLNNKLIRRQFIQKKGQSLAHCVKKAKLSSIQRRLITSLPIVKKAKSDRTFHLLFSRENGRELLREIKVVRGTKYADFKIQVIKGKAVAVSKTGEPPVVTKSAARSKLKKAKNVQLTSIVAKKIKPILGDGRYSILIFDQKKGQSLSEAMSLTKLSSLQKALIRKAPFTMSAKSKRWFYVLFERSGNKQLMRSFKVVRRNSSAEYAIVSHNGKLEIANSQGKISTKDSGMLRYPLRYSRVSSHFSKRRFHPILRRYQKHTGTDFAARRGTKVWAPASGIVTFKGWQRGYGRTVEIRHDNGYRTKYAHLHRYAKGLHVGKRINKKQIIAYVGNSGRSTGSHLHYEVIVKGKPRNPLRVSLPGSMKTFKTKTSERIASRYLNRLNGLIEQHLNEVRIAGNKKRK